MNTQNLQSAPETRTDPEGNVWVGNFDENFSGKGEVTKLNKTVIKGEFRNGILVRGIATLQNGDTWVVIMKEGDSMNGKGMMTFNNEKKETGEFRNRKLINGTIGHISSDEIIYIENGVPVEKPTPAPEQEVSNDALADRPITDSHGNVWVGNFDENFTGEGKETLPNRMIRTGKFREGVLANGTVQYTNGVIWTVDMTEGDGLNGRGKWQTNKDIQEGEFIDGKITNGTVTIIATGKVLYWENGTQVAQPTVTPEPEAPNNAQNKPITDSHGNIWVGNFDENFTGTGEVKLPHKVVEKGKFREGNLVDGVVKFGDGEIWDVKITEGSYAYGKGIITTGREIKNGEFGGIYIGNIINGTITNIETGEVREYRNGALVLAPIAAPEVATTPASIFIAPTSALAPEPAPERAFTFSAADFGPAATGSTFNPFGSTASALTATPAPEPTPRTPREHINTIKHIQKRDQSLYVKDKKGKLTPLPGVEEAINRVSRLCEELPEEDRRRISALGQDNIIFKKIVPTDGMLTRFLKRNKPGEPDWITMNPKWDNTVIAIDPFHLPKDDNVIKRAIGILATMLDGKEKVEDLVNHVNQKLGIYYVIRGDYEHGEISFSKSLPGVEKINKAILAMGLNTVETDTLRQSNTLILMHGQKREDYKNSKYKIIIESDTPMDEQQIAEYIRREIANLGSPRTPKGVFGKIRNHIGGILLGTGILAGGAVGVNYVATHRPAPVAPKTPGAVKPEPKKAEVAPPVNPPESVTPVVKKEESGKSKVKKVVKPPSKAKKNIRPR